MPGLSTKKRSPKDFERLCLASLLFTLLVILWGAFTRFSHSGDGCGSDWPLCKGGLMPDSLPALVEWTHRATSGLAFLLVAAVAFLAFKWRPPGPARKFALLSAVFMIFEAAIGAVLALAALTGGSDSPYRAAVLALHLLNSLLLAASLLLCKRSARASHFSINKPLAAFSGAFLLLALTGSMASLSNTLFPSQSLSEALALDFLPSAHITLRLRPFHPIAAFAFAFAAIFFCKDRWVRYAALAAAFAGASALLLLSPVFMKLGHLLTAYILWLALVRGAFSFHSGASTKSEYL